MSDPNYNPFLQRNAPAPPASPSPMSSPPNSPPPKTTSPFADPIPPMVNWSEPQGRVDQENGEADYAEEAPPDLSPKLVPFQFALDGNDRFSKWFWSFASAALVVGILMLVIVQLLVMPLMQPQGNPAIGFLISAVIAAIYGAAHATRRMGKVCRAIHIDYDRIRLTYGSRDHLIDPLQVDAVMALSGIDLNGEGKGFSNLRSLALLTGTKVEKIGFEPISNGRIFNALREVCQHAWAVPAEGNLLPPSELAEHHADRAGIDSLRRLRKYYGRFVMQLAFSSLALITLLLVGGGLVVATMGIRQIRIGGVKLLLFGGGLVIAALSSLRTLPRELSVLRKVKETEKSLAVALGIDFAR
jgi:hypothetical protein